MTLKLWWNPFSQPSRAVKFVLNKLKIEHEVFEVAVVKDTRTVEFKANINPNGTVPTIHDGDLQIYESATAIRYLLDTYKGDEILLPRTDLKERAKVDYWLDWNNTTGRPAIEKPLKEIVSVFCFIFRELNRQCLGLKHLQMRNRRKC